VSRYRVKAEDREANDPNLRKPPDGYSVGEILYEEENENEKVCVDACGIPNPSRFGFRSRPDLSFGHWRRFRQ
jgi:hypothetical protein